MSTILWYGSEHYYILGEILNPIQQLIQRDILLHDYHHFSCDLQPTVIRPDTSKTFLTRTPIKHSVGDSTLYTVQVIP